MNPVDIELLVATYLRELDDITAIVDGRVWDDGLPANATIPCIVVTRLGGLGEYPGHLDRPRVQIDSYGNTKTVAKTLSATARAAMWLIPGSYDGAVVTACDESSGEIYLPVGSPGVPATPRYIFAVTLVAHPVSNGVPAS